MSVKETRKLFNFFKENSSNISENKQLLSDAAETASLFNKIILTFKLYPGKNPIFMKFATQFQNNLTRMFKELPVVSIRITHRGFHFASNELNLSKKDQETAEYLYNDGLRELYFQKGVGFESIRDFFSIIAKATANSNEDYDIPTLLWHGNFDHIGYITEDELLNPYAYDKDNGEPFTIEMIREIDRGGFGNGSGTGENEGDGRSDTKSGFSAGFLNSESFENSEFEKIYGFIKNENMEKEDFYNTILNTYSIPEKHIEKLHKLVKKRNSQKITSDFLDEITSRMFQSSDPEARKNLIETSSVLWEKLIMFGSVKGSTAFLRNLIRVDSRIDDTKSEEHAFIKKGVAKLSDETFLKDIFKQSEFFSEDEAPHFGEFLSLVPQNKLPFILEQISLLDSRDSRLTFLNSLSQNIEVTTFLLNTLRKTIKTAEWTVVRNTLNLLRHMKNPAVMPLLKNAVNHPKKQVQMEAISVLMEYSIEDALPVLTRALSNPDMNIRRLAFEKLLSSREPEIRTVINRKFHESSLLSLEKEELEMYFSMVIEHKREDILPLFAVHMFSDNKNLRLSVLKTLAALDDVSPISGLIEKVIATKTIQKYSGKELEFFFYLVKPEIFENLIPHLNMILSIKSGIFSKQSGKIKDALFKSLMKIMHEDDRILKFMKKAAKSTNKETKKLAKKRL